MKNKVYKPIASFPELLAVQEKLAKATTVEELRKLVSTDGPKVGYKAFCYILSGKMTAAQMKPDEACVFASKNPTEKDRIYSEIAEYFPDHPIAGGHR